MILLLCSWMVEALWLAMIGPRVGPIQEFWGPVEPHFLRMGLGKSLQALALLWVVLSNNLVAKAESAGLSESRPGKPKSIFFGSNGLDHSLGYYGFDRLEPLVEELLRFFFKHILSKKYGFAIGRFVWELLGLFAAFLQQNVEQLRFCYG